jgi:hypothetical protein
VPVAAGPLRPAVNHGEDDAIGLDQGMRLAALFQLQAPCRLGGGHRDDLDPFFDPQGDFGA